MKIYFALLTAVILLSCSTRKHITTQRTTIDSSYTRAVDSMTQVLDENTRFWESQIQSLSTGSVLFDTVFMPGDTIINTVTVKDGTIEARGRIKKVFVTSDKLTQERDYWHSRYDSLAAHKDTTAARVIIKTEFKDRYVKRGFPWLWFFIGMASGGVAMYFLNRFKIINV